MNVKKSIDRFVAAVVSRIFHQQQPSPMRPPEPYPETEGRQTPEMLHQQTGISDSDLERFARAQAEIEDLQEEYTGRLSRVRDEYKAGLIQQEYGRQMAEVVEKTGLSLDRYNQILRASRMNPLLREKIEALSR